MTSKKLLVIASINLFSILQKKGSEIIKILGIRWSPFNKFDHKTFTHVTVHMMVLDSKRNGQACHIFKGYHM